jgi:4-amino-4-deoxy-L-arabinose transferase-like glycosyltransferase
MGVNSPSLTRSSWTRSASWTVLLFLAVFIWLAFLGFILPVDPDEAVYQIVATGMLDGQWPYRDLFDHKPPLIYVWHVPGALGAGILGERLIAALACAASLPVLGAVARRQSQTPRQVRLTLASYALLLANPFLGVNANTEAFSLLPIVAAFAVSSPLAAGALLGVAVMTKPVALLFLPVLAWHWYRRVPLVLAGVAVIVLAVCLPFAPVWSDFWESNIEFNLRYGREISVLDRLKLFFLVHPLLILGALPVWVAAVVGAFRTRRAILILWAASGYVAAKATGYDFTHYYILLLPPVALLAGLGFDRYLTRRAVRWVSPLSVSLAASVAFLGVALLSAQADDPFDEFVRSNGELPPGELYVLGFRSEIYAYAGRQPERRFFFSVPLILSEEWGRTARAELARCPPVVLVIPDEDPLFPVDWSPEIAQLYRVRQEYERGIVLTEPLRPCDRAGR